MTGQELVLDGGYTIQKIANLNRCYRIDSTFFEYFKTIDEKTRYSLGFRLKIEMKILYDEAIHNN